MGLRTPKLFIDNDGAMSVLLVNKTGANSVQGDALKMDTANDLAVVLCAADDVFTVGAFRDSGVADGSAAWVQIAGAALVHFDASGAGRGDWVGTSGTANRMEAVATPPGSTALHFQETGHCGQVAAANGTARVIMHFN
jgi:hypothetical protein